MKITNTAIRYRTTIMVLTVLLTLGGLYSYTTIPKEASPSIEVPYIIVTTIYPGASPDDIETLITQHIEQEVQPINGIKEIRSTSTEGVSSVIIEFDPDVSIDEAFAKVRDKVDIAKVDLPSDVEEPMVDEIDFTQFPIMSINLSAGYPLPRLKDVAEELQEEIEALPSVLGVDLVGGLEREVQVDLDLAALQGYNLTFDDVVTAIREENTNMPGGSVDVDRLNYLVRVNGEFEDPAEIEELVVKSPGGVPIYVRDLADVVFGFKDRASYARLALFKEEFVEGDLRTISDRPETLPVITLNVKIRSGENILSTVEAVDALLGTFPLPTGTQLVITGDQSEFVRELITDLENNIIAGLLFVIAVLLFFLGVRNSVLVGIAIPLSMFVSFIVLQALGYTLNFIILFSLIIALGMLVDNAIVIVENIYRFREEGHSKLEAARLGTAEVAGAVIASTATTVAVFVPMLFWPGVIGEFMSYMPLTLIITLSCSLFVAIIINPVLTGIFVRLETEERRPMSVRTRRVAGIVTAVVAVVVGLTNWKSLLVLGVAIPLVYLLHIRLLRGIGEWFIRKGLPRIIAAYRAQLEWMLERDYGVSRALLRNTFALASFTLGLALLILGGVLSGALGQLPALVFLVPGGVLAVVGVVAVLVHSAENLYLAGRISLIVGLVFAVLAVGVLGLMSLGRTEVPLFVVGELMAVPGIIIVLGLLGHLFNRRKYLILTDNRARLLNGTLGAFIAILAMFVLVPTGVEFFPDTDPRQIRITASGPLGMNIEASDQLADEVDGRLRALVDQVPEVGASLKNVLVNVGVGGDVGFGGPAASAERSRVTMNLVDYSDRAEPSRSTLTRIRESLVGIPGADIEITKDENGPPVGSPVNIEVTGPEFSGIERIAGEVLGRLTEASETGRIPGLVDVRDNLDAGRPELRVRIDRERAARFGISTMKIASTVRSAINGIEAGKYREDDDEYDITVRLRETDRASLESLNNLTILEEGTQIPLVAVADLEVAAGLGSITRLDLQRVATVVGEAAPGYNGQAILAQVQEVLAPYAASLPAGYALAYTGENEEQQESFGFLTVVLLLGVSLIFMIMVAQFNSVSSPFIIMVAVGFSLIGVLLGLILTRTPFGLMTFIGVISLAGIVVNNNIVLVDYTMQLRQRGVSKRDAIIEAGATRFRPVVLTAMTTVLGLIPLTFGINLDFVGLLVNLDPDFQFGSENTQFWGPMGTAIIAGLTFATFLTLVIVPVMYSVFDSLSERVSGYFREHVHRPIRPAGGFDGDGLAGDLSATDVEEVRRPVAAPKR
jgi:multidrug efflux pump subunit AcrB